jgi:cytochrome c biogenesis protein CcdA
VLLFVVLFYVYPLKFLMTLLLGPSGALLGGHVDAETGMRMPALMTMYGAGFVAVFLLLAALHWRARQCLRADPEPSTDMRMLDVDLGACLVYVAIGVVSLGIASLPWRWAPGVAGIAYALLGPAHFLYHHFIVPRAIGRPGLPSQSPQV